MPLVRRSVYIGLGGAGIESILETKRLFLETYGEIPPMVKFLAIDTDGYCREYCENDREGRGISLDRRELCWLRNTNCKSFIQAHHQRMPWLNAHITEHHGGDFFLGTRMTRSIGRLAFVMNLNEIRHAIEAACQQAMEAPVNNPYLVPQMPLEIHLAFSIAGRTGGGIFIDLAYLIRKMFGQAVKLTGHIILPGVFQETPLSPHFHIASSIGYTSLIELNYLMQRNPGDEPVTFDWISDSFTAQDFANTPRPFDWVQLIDNRNIFGCVISRKSDVTDALGQWLFAAGGNIGIQHDAILDAASPVAQEHNFWASGIGATSLVHFKEKAARALSERIALRTVRHMLSDEQSMGRRLANEWIDKIGLYRQFYDSWFHLGQHDTLCILDVKHPHPSLSKFLGTVPKGIMRSVEKAGMAWKIEFYRSLESEIDQILCASDQGLDQAGHFLAEALDIIRDYCESISEDRDDYDRRRNASKEELCASVDRLEKVSNAFLRIFRRGEIEMARNECEELSGKWAQYELEYQRLTLTQTILEGFTGLEEPFLRGQIAKLRERRDMLEKVKERLKEMVSDQTRELTHGDSFPEIDLADIAVLQTDVDSITPSADGFTAHIGKYGWDRIETEDALLKALLAYAESHPEYVRMKNMDVHDVVEALPDEDLLLVFDTAYRHSVPWLTFNDNWFVRETRDYELVVGVENSAQFPFERIQPYPCHMRVSPRTTMNRSRILFISRVLLFPIRSIKSLDYMRRLCHVDPDFTCYLDPALSNLVWQTDYLL